MTPKDDYIRALLAKLNPVRDEDLASLSHTAAAEALFLEVVSVDEPEDKRSTRPDSVPTQGEAGQWHQFKRPASGGRRRFGARRLVPTVLALALVLGGGTAGFWALHALGARDSKQVIVIGDQTQSGASSTAPGNGLLANPYPLAMSMTTQTTAAPHAGVTAAPPSDPTWRESAWAKDLGKAIVDDYLGENWVLVDAFESLLPTPQMVIEIVPRTGNAYLGSDQAPNAYVQVIVQRADDQASRIFSTTTVVKQDEQAGAHATTTLLFKPDGQADTNASTPPPPTTPFGRDNQGGAGASTTTLGTPFKLDGSFLAASVQRADRLQIDVTARVLSAEAEPYKPPLDGAGAKKLADFVSSIIELAAPTAK